MQFNFAAVSMDGILVVCLIVFSWSFISVTDGENSLARGFNDNINWLTLEDGEKLSKELNRPLMLIIHKSWCGACKALKPQFAASKEIEELSKEFVMVNLADSEEPADPKFSPDGGYIPRILFQDPKGNVLTEIVNEGGNSNYKYYYPSPNDIAKSMRTCLNKLKSASGAGEL